MSQRSVVVTLEARYNNYVNGMNQAAAATDKAAASADKLGKSSTTMGNSTNIANGALARATAERTKMTVAGRNLQIAEMNLAKVRGTSRSTTQQVLQAENAVDKARLGYQKSADNYREALIRGKEAQIQATDAAARDTAIRHEQAASVDRVAGSFMKSGAVLVGLVGLTAKAAMDWQTAWAGVTKTVDGTPEQMAELEKGLRGLARTLPQTHQEIAQVAETAGQLGVARKDVLGFTKTMLDLGQSTNLTSDEAATAIAQISNVTGLLKTQGADGVRRFASTLVELGNNGASTEKQIVRMAQYMMGAAVTAGASNQDLLALSNTLASMGVRAELGGGVTTRVLLKMNSAVKAGGKEIKAWSALAGVSSREFATAFSQSPVKALDLVTKGLNKVNKSGGDVSGALSSIGLKGTQNTQVMLSLANSGNLLSESLDMANKAWNENSALTEEATKRYATAESRVKIAWNNIKDAAITAGQTILPAIAQMADGVAGIAQGFGSIPAPVQGAVVAFSALAGAGLLAVGGIMKGVKSFGEFRDAMDSLTASGSKVPGMLGTIAKAAGVAAAAYAAFTTAASVAAATNESSTASVGKFLNAIQGGAKNSRKSLDSINDGFKNINKITGDAATSGFTAVNDLDSALKRLFNPTFMDQSDDFWNTVFGQKANSGSERTKAAISELDSAIATMASSGHADDAAAAINKVLDAAKAQGKGFNDILPLFPKYADAARAAASANGQTQLSQEELEKAMLNGIAATDAAGGAAKDTGNAFEEAGKQASQSAKEIQDMYDAMFAAANLMISSNDSQIAYQETLAAFPDKMKQFASGAGVMSDALTKTGDDFDRTSERGREANKTFNDFAVKGQKQFIDMAKSGRYSQEELAKALQGTYDALKKAADGMTTTDAQADALARQVLNIPTGVDIKTWISSQAEEGADATTEAVNGVPKKVDVSTKMDKNVWSVATDTTKAVKGIPPTAKVQSWMSTDGMRVANATDSAVKNIKPKAEVSSWMSTAAQSVAWATRDAVNSIPSYKEVKIRTIQESIQEVIKVTTNVFKGKATGGSIDGSGPKGVDSVPIMAAPGEHMLTAQEVDMMGGQGAVYAFRAALRNGGGMPQQYLAEGGAVGRQTSARSLMLPPAPQTVHAAPTRTVTQQFFGIDNPYAVAQYARQRESGNTVIEGSRLG